MPLTIRKGWAEPLRDIAAEAGLDELNAKRFALFFSAFEADRSNLSRSYAREWAHRFARDQEYGRGPATDSILVKIDGREAAIRRLHLTLLANEWGVHEAAQTATTEIEEAIAYGKSASAANPRNPVSTRKAKKPVVKTCTCRRT